MSNTFSNHCPRCNEVVEYTGEATWLQCVCGHQFLVAEFVSERRKMEQTAADRDAAQKKLSETVTERDALQARLNNTLTALEHIEGTQAASDDTLKAILAGMKKDRQAHDAMAELLRAIKADQAEGQDGLIQLLRAVMKEQGSADAKLDAVKQLAGQILQAQEAGAGALRAMRRDIEDRIYELKLDDEEREKLYSEFFDWSRSVQEEDAQRLKKLQASSDVLLQSQQKISEKLSGLEQGIKDAKDAVLHGFDEQRKWRLDKLIGRYNKATKYQARRDFEKAESEYEELISDYQEAECAEVYWRLLLCHYGVEYQKEQDALIPIILRPDLMTPMESLDIYKDLQKHIKTREEEEYYNTRLKKINFYLQRYREVKQNPEWKFDIFISVKQNYNNERTPDYKAGLNLYKRLVLDDKVLAAKKLKVFNSEITPLPEGEPFEPYIIAALMSAKVLIVVGSKPEFMASQWVRNEWSRFQYLQKTDIDKTNHTDRKLFCYLTAGMNAKQIPRELDPNNQAIEDGPNAGDRLREVIEKAFPTAAAEQTPSGYSQPGDNAKTILARVEAWLKLGKYQKVIGKCEELENDRPELLQEAPWLCIYTLCAQNECRTLDKLIEKRPEVWKEPLYEIAYENADDELKQTLDGLKKRYASPVNVNKPAPQSQQQPKPASKPQSKPAPKPQTTPLDTFAKYTAALEGEVKQRNRELTMVEIDDFISKYNLGVKQIGRTEVRKDLEDVYVKLGLKKVAPKQQPTPASKSEGAVNAGSGSWQVILTGCNPAKKLLIIKEIRMLLECGLAEAKKISESCPYCLARNISKAEAERIQQVFASVGAETRIQKSGSDDPKSAPKPAPKPQTTPLDTFAKYTAALESEVRLRNRELTMVEIDDFISKYNLGVKQIGRTEVRKDLEDVYVKLGIKKVAPKPQTGPEKKKIVTSQYSYEGEVKDGKMHGQGRILWANGEKYEGGFQNDKRNGTGTYYYKSGNRYEGAWKEDQRTGKGTFYWADGEKYVGDFLNAKMHGTGTYYYKNGNRYEGDWKEDQRTGKGTFYWADGEKYVGGYQNGKKHGTGTYYFKNGERYEGDWKDDQRAGKGTYYYTNGEKYVGGYQNGKRNGTGTYYFKSGDRYEGDWKEDQRTGQGALYWTDGEKYVGGYQNGKKHGTGTYYFKNGERYEGDWREDQRTGEGAYYFKNGERYIGDFLNGKRTGKGTYYFANGDKYVGDFQEGSFAGAGTYYKANGEVLPYKDGKAAPALKLKDRKAYLDALEAYVKSQKKARLTADQVDSFHKFHRLHEPNLTRAMVESDLEDVYVRLGISKTVNKPVEPVWSASKPEDSADRKKELTDAAATEFWRNWLPKVNASAVVKPQLTSAEEDAARKAVGTWVAATVNVLGTIHINHGLFKGHTVVIIAKDRLYINVNNKLACPPIEMQFRYMHGAEAVPVAGGKNRLILKTTTGTKEFASPASHERDALKFGVLADAINQFIKTFKL